MTQSGEDVIDVKGKCASAWDQFFLNWGQETLKGSVPAINDALGKMLTLTSALIGGGFVALKGDIIPFNWGVAAVSCLMASLIAALIGLMPVSRRVMLNNPASIRDAEESAGDRKQWCLMASFVLLVAGFALAFCGVIVKGS